MILSSKNTFVLNSMDIGRFNLSADVDITFASAGIERLSMYI